MLLPDWPGRDTWGRNYWDWPCSVQVENVTEFACRYLMNHPEEFPQLAERCPQHRDVVPQSHVCRPRVSRRHVQRGLGVPRIRRLLRPFTVVRADGAGQCLGPVRRADRQRVGPRDRPPSDILSTYDFHETGVVEDNIDGGQIVAGAWFKIAHPMALKHCLAVIRLDAGPLRLQAKRPFSVRSTTDVTSVSYERDRVSYSVHGSAGQPMVEVLRLKSEPRASVREGEGQLKIVREPQSAESPGAVLKTLDGGDCILTLNHQASGQITIDLERSEDGVATPASTGGPAADRPMPNDGSSDTPIAPTTWIKLATAGTPRPMVVR